MLLLLLSLLSSYALRIEAPALCQGKPQVGREGFVSMHLVFPLDVSLKLLLGGQRSHCIDCFLVYPAAAAVSLIVPSVSCCSATGGLIARQKM